jgi:exodeoxyribonuclease VII large subunit
VDFSLFSTPEIWAVSDLTRYIRQTLESDYRLQELWVMGEVSNVSRPSSGHLYFTLKDDQTSLRCVMWRSHVDAQLRLPREGEALEVFGRISVYEAAGQYQLYAEQLRPAGEGARHLDFLRLKEKLEGEGLFDPARKQPIPEQPAIIGVVTSPTGAALHDVLHVLRRRYPLVKVLLAPTPVQGEEALQGIIHALSLLARHGESEVILLVRGGGSAEDMAVFNTEDVVRAVADSPIPIISGVGHETDLILTDFAADVRAPTPSAAAELATPDQSVLVDELNELRTQSIQSFAERVVGLRQALSVLQARLKSVSPLARILNDRQRLDDRMHRARTAMDYRMALTRASTQNLDLALRAFSPDAVLQRGYALVTRTHDGRLVSSTTQVQPGEHIRIRVSDGSLEAEVQES